MDKLQELLEEFKAVFSGGRSRWFDSFIPLLVFLIINPLFGLNDALWAALAAAGILALYRVFQRKSLAYALGGLGGVLLAALFVNLSGSEAGFFLPGLISGAVTVVVCVVSVALNRPIAAWSRFITRRWPLDWYWHPRVAPAYREVTIFWSVAFSARLLLEYWLFQQEAVSALGAIRVFLGWPYIVILLIISYLYGLWRLGNLGGPSVDEFRMGKEPPWLGQTRGF
jgi:hypothetical protein